MNQSLHAKLGYVTKEQVSLLTNQFHNFRIGEGKLVQYSESTHHDAFYAGDYLRIAQKVKNLALLTRDIYENAVHQLD